MNICIIYEINKNLNISSYPVVGAVKLTKRPDIHQYKYSGYGIGFDKRRFFSLDNKIGRNLMIFGVDMSSSPHIDNKKRYFNSWKRFYLRIRTNSDCRKIIFSQRYEK